MKKKNLTLLIIIIILVILIVGWVVWKLIAGPQYSAVYFSTGELYFGKVVRFPSYGLKQAYSMQVNPQNEENPLSVQRFKNIFWGPEDFVRINRDNIIWTVKLDSEGRMAKLLEQNPDLAPQQSAPQQPAPSQGAVQPTAPGTGQQLIPSE